MPLTPLTRLGSYEILAPLGAGGMGEVYRAKDLRLGREIALKVLPADVAGNAERLARFDREARTVAALNHPGIVTLFSVEEDGGTRFLTMELVEGQTLDQAVVPGGLPIARVIALGIALADALSAAHEKGVVHRDLKPANVMLTRDGRVKVLDFGLAKAAAAAFDSGLTQAATRAAPLSSAGQAVGTVPYMAPEQVRGEAVDARTDLFALGVVLYELVAGERPFVGATPADILSAILRDPPAPLAGAREDLPADLERIVSRCLEKNPRERMQSSLDVGNELRRLQRDLERGASAPAAPAVARRASIAVLPFANRSASADDEYFSDGLADELLNVLSKVEGLRVIARASAFQFKGGRTPLAEIGRTLDVATVLDGSVRKAGTRARISVQLVRVSDSSHLWSETYDRTLDDIFAVQDEIAQSVVKELRTTLLGEKADSNAAREAKADLARAPGHSADREAYDLYLRGRHQLSRRSHESLHRSVAYFTAALERDPDYALAELGLAEAHGLLAFHEFEPPREAFPRARAAAVRALSRIPDLGEAHAVLAYTALHHDREWEVAEREYRRAIELNPRHAITRLWYANLLTASGRFEEAREQGRIALELDPLSIIINLVMGWVKFFERRFEDAYEEMSRALELEPGFFQAHSWRGAAAAQMGRHEEATKHLETAAELAQHPPTVMFLRALAAGVAGRSAECRERVERLVAMREERYVSGFIIAVGYLAAGDPDAAEPWILRAAEDRSPWVNFMRVDPRVAALVERPKVKAIVERLGTGA